MPSHKVTDLKSLNQIAHRQLRFGSLYFPVSFGSPPLFISHSPRQGEGRVSCPVYELEVRTQGETRAPATSSVPEDRIPHSGSAQPSDIKVLNRLAHSVTQFGFVYPEMKIPVGPPSRREFFSLRVSDSSIEAERKERLAHMKELNRMARAVEVTSRSCPLVPVYPEFLSPRQTLGPAFKAASRYGKGFPNPFALSLRSRLSLLPSSSFDQAFPGTAKPRITMFSGQPRTDRLWFNSALKSKLGQARSLLKSTCSPPGLSQQLIAWINSILLRLVPKYNPLSASKVAAKPVSSKQKDNTTPGKAKVEFVLPEPHVSTPPPTSSSPDNVSVNESVSVVLTRLVPDSVLRDFKATRPIVDRRLAFGSSTMPRLDLSSIPQHVPSPSDLFAIVVEANRLKSLATLCYDSHFDYSTDLFTRMILVSWNYLQFPVDAPLFTGLWISFNNPNSGSSIIPLLDAIVNHVSVIRSGQFLPIMDSLAGPPPPRSIDSELMA